MREIIAIIVFINFTLPANCQIKTGYSDNSLIGDEYLEDTLSGRVKSIIEYQYSLNSTNDKELDHKTIRIFDEQGRIIEDADTAYGSISKYVFKYDNNGKLTNKDYYRWKFLIAREVYIYDDYDNIAKIEEYNHKEILVRKTIFLYDRHNNKIKSTVYKPNKKTFSKEIWNYDSTNNIREYMITGKDVSYLSTKKVYKYNEINKLSEVDEYNKDGTFWIRTLKQYNSKGDIIESATYFENNFLRNKSIYSYSGQTIERADTLYSSNGINYSTYHYTYETFDSANNWLKLVSLKDGRIYFIKEREIAYY